VDAGGLRPLEGRREEGTTGLERMEAGGALQAYQFRLHGPANGRLSGKRGCGVIT
jgi:hypothetical protein